MANGVHWSKKEIKFLKDNYKKLSANCLSKKLNRSSYAIYHMAANLDLTDKSKRLDNWTADEIDILKKNYQKIGLNQVCKLLNRTRAAIQSKARKLKIQPKRTPSKGIRAYKLKHRFDLTIENWQQMYDAQNGKCPVCGRHQSKLDKRLAVHHLEIDGEKIIIALLCCSCNLMIGNANHNADLLRKAANFIDEYH